MTKGLNAKQIEVALFLHQQELYKRNFYEFVKFCAPLLENTDWKWNFHHEYICNKLQEEIIRIKNKQPRKKHLIINVPFRSSKSLIVSICLPLWTAIIAPELSFINLSYSANLSTDHSNKVVALINNPEFKRYFDLEFENNQFAKTDFKLKNGFSRLSGGVTGTVLGRGATVIVLDDPNNTKRLSEVERENTIRAWRDTISTRLNQPETNLFIVVQQRLHFYDLSGYLLEKESDKWEHICLPAELDNNISPSFLSVNYQEGLLWKERFSKEVLANFHSTLGSVGYANQLQQKVVPDSGNIIQRHWIQKITPERFQDLITLNHITPTWDIFVDTAQSEKRSADPTGIMVCCKLLNNVYVRKAIEKKLSFPDLILALRDEITKYGNGSSRVFIEPKSSGLDVIAQLKRQTKFNIVELPSPKDDKMTRLQAVSPFIEGGRLILIEDLSKDLVIDELILFPNAQHDEFVDLVGYALKQYLSTSGIKIKKVIR